MMWYYSTLAAFQSHVFVYPFDAVGTAGTEGGTYMDMLSGKITEQASGTVFQIEHRML